MVMTLNPNDLVVGAANAEEPVCPNCGCIIMSDESGTWCNCNPDVASKEKLPVTPEVPVVEKVTVVKAAATTDETKPLLPSAILKTLSGAPSEAQIQAWKQQFGSVYVLPFALNELYVWRPISRREWQTIQMNEALVKDENKFQEYVVVRGVLWPKMTPEKINFSRAGIIPTLFAAIMHGSYFLPIEYALQTTEEL